MTVASRPVSRDGLALRAFLVPTFRPTDLARQAGCTRQYVYAVLNGERPPSARLLKAAGELGLPVEALFGQSPQMRVPALAGTKGTRDELDDAENT